MKKLKRFFKELWLERVEILKVLAYGLATVWYGYILRIIAKADIGIFPVVLLFIGGIALAIFTFVGIYTALSEDDE